MNSISSTVVEPEIPNSILMICDNFWIGGRETFLEDVVYLLRKIGVKSISLLAGNISNTQVKHTFDNATNVGGNLSLNQWLEVGNLFIAQTSPQLIWAHHYSLTPALLLAKKHKLPLHITLHGPILSAGKYDDQDALAFSLAASSGATFSGVSEEIIRQLFSFHLESSCWGVFPNKVRRKNIMPKQNPKLGKTDKGKADLTFAAFSRQSKLEHLRQAVLLTHEFKRHGHNVKIDLYTGIIEEKRSTDISHRSVRQIGNLLGRKWLAKNPQLLFFLKHIQLHPLTNDVTSAMAQYDIILGMGRVSLEAIANSKVSILIGYERIIGVLNIDTFDKYQTTNFSGRQQSSNSPEKIIEDTLEALKSEPRSINELSTLADIESLRPNLKSLLTYASTSKEISIQNGSITDFFSIDNGEKIDDNFIQNALLTPSQKNILLTLLGASI